MFLERTEFSTHVISAEMKALIEKELTQGGSLWNAGG